MARKRTGGRDLHSHGERRPIHPSTASADEQVPRNPCRASSVDADPLDITQTPEVQEVTPARVLS